MVKFVDASELNDFDWSGLGVEQPDDKKSPQQSQIAPVSQPGSGFGGIRQDIAESLLSAPGAAYQFLSEDVPEQVSSLAQQRLEKGLLPTLGQSALGIPELASKIQSAPLVGARYATQKLAPESRFAKALQETPTPFELLQEGEQAAGLAPKTKGEEAARGAGELVSGGKLLGRLGSPAQRAGAIATQAAGAEQDPIHAYLGARLGEKAGQTVARTPQAVRNIYERRKLPEKMQEAEQAAQEQESALKRTKYEAGASDPEKLEVEADQLQERLQQLNQQSDEMQQAESDLSDQLNQALSEQNDLKPIDKESLLPDLRYQEQFQNASDLYDQSLEHVENAHQSQAEQLGKGLNHAERASPLIEQGVEAEKAKIRPLYQQVDQELENRNVTIPNQERTQEITKEMNRLIDQGIVQSENDPIYDNIFNQLKEKWPGDDEQIIPATEFVKNYRAVRDMSRIARQRSREEGITGEQRNRWEKQAKQLSEIEQQYSQALENNLPADTYDKFLEATRLWGQNVIPFYSNKIYRKVKKEGLAPDDIIKTARGSNESSRAMQKLIQDNPDLNRLALGQKYAENPNKILTYDEASQPYIEAHAPTRRLIQVQRNALERNQRASELKKQAGNRYEQKLGELEGASKKIDEENEAIRQESQKKQKEINQLLQKNEKLQNQKQETQDKIQKLSNDYQKNQRNQKLLREQIRKYGATQERLKELRRIEKQNEKMKSKLWAVVTSALGYITGKNLLTSIFGIVSK